MHTTPRDSSYEQLEDTRVPHAHLRDPHTRPQQLRKDKFSAEMRRCHRFRPPSATTLGTVERRGKYGMRIPVFGGIPGWGT